MAVEESISMFSVVDGMGRIRRGESSSSSLSVLPSLSAPAALAELPSAPLRFTTPLLKQHAYAELVRDHTLKAVRVNIKENDAAYVEYIQRNVVLVSNKITSKLYDSRSSLK